jgi:hypothetical protein
MVREIGAAARLMEIDGLSFGEHGLGRFGEAVTSFSVFCFFFLFHPSFSYVQRERERLHLR